MTQSPVADYDLPASPTVAAGLLLLAATTAALALANSPLAPLYQGVLHATVWGLSVHHWIDQGVMALFFLLVGLEIKRELLTGALATPASRLLPVAAAVVGVIVPAACFLAVAGTGALARRGWAVPTATDIAFVLAIVAALGSRVPPALRSFLTAVAVIDDLCAILVIGLFFSAQIDLPLLGAAAIGIAAMLALARAGIDSLIPYLLVGAGVWAAVHASGVHATVAGVAVGLAMPATSAGGSASPLDRLEDRLAPLVGFGVVPLFSLASAGVRFDLPLRELAAPIPVAIVVALVLGKQVGIFGATGALKLAGLTALPGTASWRQVHGAAVLCGIGFTMSLFIAGLAFGEGSAYEASAKIAILFGSLLSAVLGYVLLRVAR